MSEVLSGKVGSGVALRRGFQILMCSMFVR